MSFLDVLVKRETDGSETTSVYRKKTHSDRYLHFYSDHPLKDKIIGESKRRNKTRFAEHIKACENLKTKKKFIQSEKNDTGLPYHVFMTGHSFNFENAEILCQESNWRKRKLLEALHIELTPNTCNLHKGKSFDNNWLTFLKYFKTLDNTSEVRQFQENR